MGFLFFVLFSINALEKEIIVHFTGAALKRYPMYSLSSLSTDMNDRIPPFLSTV